MGSARLQTSNPAAPAAFAPGQGPQVLRSPAKTGGRFNSKNSILTSLLTKKMN